MPRFTAEELAAAAGKTIPDVLAPGLRVVFAGINPGLWSAAAGHHFARPATSPRLRPGVPPWHALYASGFTPRLLRPDEQTELLEYGLGVTNTVARATAKAGELSDEELRAGGRRLVRKMERLRPSRLAVAGVTAYRKAFNGPKTVIGRQERTLGDTRIWVLPSPSGLNAVTTTPRS